MSLAFFSFVVPDHPSFNIERVSSLPGSTFPPSLALAGQQKTILLGGPSLLEQVHTSLRLDCPRQVNLTNLQRPQENRHEHGQNIIVRLNILR